MKVVRIAVTLASIWWSIWCASIAHAQDVPTEENADTLFVTKVHQPISYLTTYDRNVSRGEWFQSLSYSQTTNRLAFNTDGSLTSIQGFHGLENNGITGNIHGSLDWRASQGWIWSVDGKFSGISNNDKSSTTAMRANKLQIRTQYTANPWKNLTAVGIVFGELDQDQNQKSTIFSSRDTLADTTTVPPTIYRSHVGRDSSYNAGPRAGFNGSATWKPVTWLETRGVAILTRTSTTAFIRNTDFWELEPNVGATKVISSDTSLVIPNGDDQYEARARVTAIPKGLAEIVVRAHDTDQPYYDPSQRALEHLTLTNRNGTFHLEQAPFRGAQFTLDGTLSHLLKVYTLQKRYTGETNTQSVTANFASYRPYDRFGFGFQVSNARNDRQFNGNGNGNVINRALNASVTHRVTNRLWLDANTSISLFSLLYDGTGNIADQDNVKAYGYGGGGYRIASTCSTTVHLSVNRNHKVAISESASGQNNITTNYQLEGTLNFQPTPTLLILQNYRLSANYLIYDYDEPHNTLTRLRTVDTVIQDSLFTFASVKLTHNFFFQDHGAYSRSSPDEGRSYALDQQLYQQNLGVSFSLRPWQGIVFYATQSLSNTRTYFFNGFPNTIRNRWSLNYGVNIDRDLPGAMGLHGNIQHVGEYTELPDNLPSRDQVNYWLAGVTFSKDF